MKKISFWARDHKIAARLLIIFLFGLINLFAISTGILLTGLGISLPTALLFCLIVVHLACFLLYPYKKNYVRRKTFDVILLVCSFSLFVFVANRPEIILKGFSTSQAVVPFNSSLPTDTVAKSYKSFFAFAASLKDPDGKTLKLKERRKLLKEQISGIRKSNELSDGEKTLLVVLSVLVATGLLFLVLGLSCNLSCSGADGAAVLVGVGGIVIVALLLVLAIRAIYGGKKKMRERRAERREKRKNIIEKER